MQSREVLFVFLVIVVGVSLAWYVDEGRDALGDLRDGKWERALDLGRVATKTYTETLAETIAGEGARLLRIRTEYGSVTVEAWDGADVDLRATKTVCMRPAATEEKASEQLAEIRVNASREGDTINISTVYGRRLDDCRAWSVDYVVKVPRDVSLDVVTSYGKLRAAGVEGDVTLGNSYSGIEATDIGGTLRIASRYGIVDARGIAGNADIEASYSAVSAEDVGGDIEVRASHSKVDAQDVRGAANIGTTYAMIAVRQVAGPIRARTKHGRIEVRSCPGDLTLTTAYAPVSVEDAAGSVGVSNQYGSVDLAFAEGPAGEVNITTSYARVTVLAPADARMTVDAVASPGRVECAYELDGSTSAGGATRAGTIIGKINGGGALLRIRNEHGAIRIAAR